MKHSCLQTLLSSSEEMEEPWPKKLKIDRSYVSLKKEHSELLERLCNVNKKPSSKPFSFPVIFWDSSRVGLELQAKKHRNLKPNLQHDTLFKPHVDVNLQSRLVENISLTEKWTLKSKDGNTIKNQSSSEFNKNCNFFITKPDSWAVLAKEREKSIQSGNISKKNELPALNTVFYNVWPGNLIAKIESLSTNVPQFQSNECDTDCHQAYECLRSNKQYIPKPLSYGEKNNSQIQYLCSPASTFMKGGKSDPELLLYEYKSLMNVNSNILSYKKQRKPPAKHFRRNKVFQHIYMPCLRKGKVINPKLVKCAAFELFLQDMRIFNYSTSVEINDTTIFSQIIVLNTQLRKISNEKCTKECLRFSRDTMKELIFSVLSNEEQMRKLIHSNNQSLPDNNYPSSSLWKESLCNSKLMYSLTANSGLFNCLTSFPIKFEKPSFKHSGIQTVVMETYVQREKGKTFQENSVLKQCNKHGTGRFSNIINFTSKSKYAPNYTRACKKPVMNKSRYRNFKDGQETFCGFVDKQAHFSCFDTFQKICLSAEVDEIYLISNVMFHAEKKEKYSKVYTATEKRISNSNSSISNYSCVPSKLFTKLNILLGQGIKEERSHCPKGINQCSQCEINNVTFPINSLISGSILKFSSNVHQYFTSAVSHDLIDQSIVSINGWQSKTAIHGKRAIQNNFAFEKNKHIIQYQSLCSSRFYNSFKYHNTEEVEGENLFLHKHILWNNTHNSEEISVKQNAEDVNKTENVIIEQSHKRKRNQPLNLTVPYLKDKSTKSVGFKDKSVLSSTMIQHFDDGIEEHFSLNPQLVNRRYESEMKKHFDMVLKELHMFNEISKENENILACREGNEINKEISKENENSLTCLERDIIEKDPLVLSHCEMPDEDSKTFSENKYMSGITVNSSVVQQSKNEQCSFKDIVLKRPGEQEVPHDFFVSSTSDEDLFYSPSEEPCSSQSKQPLTWKPVFVPHLFTEERSFSFKTERDILKNKWTKKILQEPRSLNQNTHSSI